MTARAEAAFYYHGVMWLNAGGAVDQRPPTRLDRLVPAGAPTSTAWTESPMKAIVQDTYGAPDAQGAPERTR
jgi:hypothetical protein